MGSITQQAVVACSCCKKQRATWLVRDDAFHVWHACETCKRECQKHPAYRGSVFVRIKAEGKEQ